MSLPAIAVRVLFAYLFLLLIVRVSGKRTIRQVTPLDFTAALILGDLVDDLFWGEVPAAQFVVAAGVLLSLAVAVTLGPTLTPALGRLLNGAPTEVIRDGDWVRGGLRKERMAETDVLALLRQQGVRDLREVRSACVETDGQLGVIRRDWGDDAQRQDIVQVRQAAGGML